MCIRAQFLGLDWLCACGVLDHSIVAPGLKLSPPAHKKEDENKVQHIFDPALLDLEVATVKNVVYFHRNE
jgi:hypothetical protein